MAYAAVISVLKTLVELQHPFPFQEIDYPGSQVRDLQENLIFLKDFLETISPKARYLEDLIRVAMYDAEDALDSNLLNFIPNSESSGWAEDNYMRSFSRALEKVNNTVGSIAKEAKEISPNVKRPLPLLMPPTPEVSRRNLIVGREDDLTNLKSRLTGGSDKLAAVPIYGIRGIGKTRLAQTVYDDPEIVNMFRFRAWVKVSQDYSKKEILLGVLRSMSKLDSGKGQEIAEDDLAELLFKNLRLGKYLIVLDEVCDPEAWDNLKELFPDYYIGSRVMLTTRMKEVAENGGDFMKILPLDGEESWALLQSEVFRYKACPEELVTTAKRVSTNCKGIPLAIVTIGGVLMEAGPKDWAIAASSLNDCGDCDELIDAVLSLSFKSLRQYAKACLLYMGIFPNNYDIPLSKLLKLWIAEGFIECNEQFNSPEKMGEGCLSMLVERGFVVVSKKSPLGKISTCRVDGVYYEFLKKKAKEEKFFHVVNDYTSSFPDETCTHGRFSIRENIQFEGKYELKLKKPVRSLLFNGAKEQYPLWVHFNFKLLRVLDALKIQFYSFPDEILKLIHLRYLALTYSGEIPDKICGLWNLQFLIILRHLSSKTFEVVLRLPLEIWNMSELRHLQLMGRNLPDPSTTIIQLENLVTLLDVSSHSCTQKFSREFPT
ncbi:putative late blight resistance protein homolog R1B-16 [Salvia splendens]|uniref:putative late blight resistance protein homolog R1B-16 n=1 Tax=Salvia splendens TaxID=180675 RepID=UPI001C26033C|nr:putative late blight resistance protein homolog R1B-16 [Salvia splendens]